MEEKFEIWALVELMGHNKIAGRVTEHKFGNQSMLRVDVPAVNNLPAFSKIIAVNAVYAINPMTELDATYIATQLKTKPLDTWDMDQIFQDRINELIKKGYLQKPELAPVYESEEDDGNPFD